MPYHQQEMTIFSEAYINSEFTSAEYLASKCTSLLLARKLVLRNYQYFCKHFKPKNAF